MPDKPRRNTAECSERIALEQAMNIYLSNFGEALKLGFFGEKTGTYNIFYKSHGRPLIWAAKTFDEQTMNGIGYPQLAVGDEAGQLIKYINRTDLIGLKKSFSEVFTDYCTDLRGDLRAIVKQVQTRRMKYLMDDVLWYNEGVVEDMEALSKKFSWATGEVRGQLCLRSPEYLALDNKRGERARQATERFEKTGFGSKKFM